MTYERFLEQDKIPCSTVLIRVRKALKSPKGDLMSISDYPDHLMATQLGILEPPPNYKEATYNTLFTRTSNIEDRVIYPEKNQRQDPILVDLITSLYIEQSGKNHNMNESELTNWAERNLLKPPPLDAAEMGRKPYIDL